MAAPVVEDLQAVRSAIRNVAGPTPDAGQQQGDGNTRTVAYINFRSIRTKVTGKAAHRPSHRQQR